jgi:hypothetical protein
MFIKIQILGENENDGCFKDPDQQYSLPTRHMCLSWLVINTSTFILKILTMFTPYVWVYRSFTYP